jgi:hypothetical protein
MVRKLVAVAVALALSPLAALAVELDGPKRFQGDLDKEKREKKKSKPTRVVPHRPFKHKLPKVEVDPKTGRITKVNGKVRPPPKGDAVRSHSKRPGPPEQ